MTTGPEIERIRHGNLPSPEQVGQLAVSLIEFADNHGKLVVSAGRPGRGSRRQIVKVMRTFETPSLDLPDVYLLQSTTSACMDDNLDGIRQLRIFDSLHRKELGMPGSRGVRSTYEFDWTDHKVLDARRRTVALPRPAAEPMIDVVDRMVTSHVSPFRDSDAVGLYMMSEMGQLTGGDVDRLTDDIGDLMGRIDSGERLYCETETEYMNSIGG